MDFRTGKPLGRDLDTGFYQTTMAGGGFDHCYVLDRPRGASQSLCAWASSDKTGISMKMYTTQPGIQLYTGNFLQNCPSPARAASRWKSTAALPLRPSTSPAAPLTRSSRRRCCGQAKSSGPTLRSASSPAVSAAVCKQNISRSKGAALLRELPFAVFACPLHALRTKNLCSSSDWLRICNKNTF